MLRFYAVRMAAARFVPLVLLAAMFATRLAHAAPESKVAFGARDITPDVTAASKVYVAGYGPNRVATGIHDPLLARCVVLDDGSRRIALVSVDLVGLQYPAVLQIREGLPELDYVLVSSTHNHEGPDVIGIWGKSPFHRGVDEAYVQRVVERVQQLVHETATRLEPALVDYGTAEDATLLGDSRLPIAKDGVLRLLRFRAPESGRPVGLLVQWNCHPEALGSRNRLITADFPAATIRVLQQRHECPIAYFSGALGGLMAPPRNRIRGADGQFLEDGTFEYSDRYGEAVADLAEQALQAAAPIPLTPFTVSSRAIVVPLENLMYRAARSIGVLQRPARIWEEDFEKIGPLMTRQTADEAAGVETEVAYLRLGELGVAAIPGELYPELVYGQFQEPADPAADYPQAPLEKTIVDLLPEERWLLIGLANDEIGYIIPRRQWDAQRPYAYQRTKSQYGEINSCGASVAPIIMQALANRVRDAE